MGDTGDIFRAWKEHCKERKNKLGVVCPDCIITRPKAQPKILMPGQKCWCGYRDPRKRSDFPNPQEITEKEKS